MKLVFSYLIIFLTVINLTAGEKIWIRDIIDLTINTHFDQALQKLQARIDSHPQDYRGYFYLAATINSEMTHFENHENIDLFEWAIDTTIIIVDSLLEAENKLADSVIAELLFYKGSAYGYRAFVQGNQGKWLPAISNGIKSVGYLNETLELDSARYGAYLGIGVYKYWRYSRLNFISWLPFIPDDRDQGIEMIKHAAVYDTMSCYMAMHQLVYILLDYEQPQEAIKYAEKIVEKYPQSQFMWWANAHAYFKYGDYVTAESSYLQLRQLIENDKNRNLSHLFKCDFKLALIYKKLGDLEKCVERCETVLHNSAGLDLTETMEDTISRTNDLMQDCLSQMNDTRDLEATP
jgi:tetratricopeptide (TPR) repeat protein